MKLSIVLLLAAAVILRLGLTYFDGRSLQITTAGGLLIGACGLIIGLRRVSRLSREQNSLFR